MQVFEPATEEMLAELPRASVEDADAAVARAKAAFPAWRAVKPGDRGKLLRALARRVEESLEELATLEARNAGKPISDARGEIGARTVELLEAAYRSAAERRIVSVEEL